MWPSVFVEEDRLVAAQHLDQLCSVRRQEVLDEIEWQHAQKPVRSPLALLRTLCGKSLAGRFTPDGAHRISAARRLLATTKVQTIHTANTADAQDDSQRSALAQAKVEEDKARLRAVRAAIALKPRVA